MVVVVVFMLEAVGVVGMDVGLDPNLLASTRVSRSLLFGLGQNVSRSGQGVSQLVCLKGAKLTMRMPRGVCIRGCLQGDEPYDEWNGALEVMSTFAPLDLMPMSLFVLCLLPMVE